ncbi:MAG: RdgB/HAM1 family non-canonical purine NTP pyrophosphatase [Anaerolineae bacterium]|nr:RdgB/HAM1 family non-canonical purine NTP pyrophosphatase [Anaerolineae bacterium]
MTSSSSSIERREGGSSSLLVATTNAGKLREYRAMMADLSVQWQTLEDVGLAGMDVAETETTFIGNALLKAQAYAAASGLPTMADDSGIVVDALDGAPGVYSARYAPTAAERNAKLLAALQGVPEEKRTARFVCIVAFATADGITITAEGRVEGRVGFEERGTNGFGYDPVFVLDGGLTMAEISSEAKNSLSHRGRALAKIRPLLVSWFTR